MTKPSPAIVACGCDAAPLAARSLPRFHGADSWRPPIAFAALLLACVLLPAGFFLHGHDEGDAGADDHRDCVVCCLLHHAAMAPAGVPAAWTPDVTARATPRPHRGNTRGTTLGIRPTRGPPA